jgi:hypothetical protein
MHHLPPYLVSHFDVVVLVVPATVLAQSAAPDTVLLTAVLNSPHEVQTKMRGQNQDVRKST